MYVLWVSKTYMNIIQDPEKIQLKNCFFVLDKMSFLFILFMPNSDISVTIGINIRIWRFPAHFSPLNLAPFLVRLMARSFQIETIQEKTTIINYLKFKKLPEFKSRFDKANWFRKIKNLEIVDEILFYKKGQKLLKVLVLEEKEKNKEVLESLHLPGHFGKINLFFIFRN